MDDVVSKHDFRYHFFTPVWNDKYLRLFTDYSLPSQLAPQNLPGLAARGCLYHVFTRSVEIPCIERSLAFQRLLQIVPVKVHAIDDLDLATPHLAMSECYRRGMSQAAPGDAYVFLTPDSIWSDGAFAAMDRQRRAGKRAVLVAGIRMRAEGALQELDAFRRGARTGVKPISSRDLVGVCMRHLHPASLAHLCQGGVNRAPQHYYWDVRGRGLVARCFHIHPLMVRPAVRALELPNTIDGDFVSAACPDFDAIHVVEDSDEIFVAEVSRTRQHGGLIMPSLLTPAQVRAWMAGNVNDYHRRYLKRLILIHSGDIDSTWDEAIAESHELAATLLQEGPRAADAAPHPEESQAEAGVLAALRQGLLRPIKVVGRWLLRPIVDRMEARIGQRLLQRGAVREQMQEMLTQLLLLEREAHLSRHAAAGPDRRESGNAA